jgi:hypothetical protein
MIGEVEIESKRDQGRKKLPQWKGRPPLLAINKMTQWTEK